MATGQKGKKARPKAKAKKKAGAAAKAPAVKRKSKQAAAKRTSTSKTGRSKKTAAASRAPKSTKKRGVKKAAGGTLRSGAKRKSATKSAARKSTARKARAAKSAAPKSAVGKSRVGAGKRVATKKAAKKSVERGPKAATKRVAKKAVKAASRSKTPTKRVLKPTTSPAASVRSVAKPSVAGRRGAKAPAAKKGVATPRAAGVRGTVAPVTRRAPRRQARASTPSAGRSATKARRAPTAARARPRASSPGVTIKGELGPRYDEILTADALAFLAGLHRKFDSRRKELLAMRAEQQERYDGGALPDFLEATRHVREGDWKIAPIPQDLMDRRVEITGPVDRKMVINALNSGANMYMADFEDANSPTWANNLEGQINLKDRWAGTLDFTDPASGKDYELGDNPAVLIVRPRGWHLVEQHLSVDGQPISGSLFDFGLYFFHNARRLIERGTGPYFYLPKLETHLEARLWNDVFVYAQEQLGLPLGLIKATVLIETLPAAFEMDEILYELRNHIAGLNAGRWDYIFSFIKKLAKNPDYVLPDRSQVVMGKAFLYAYALLLIRTCHHRGAFAMGGMAAQIPVRNNPKANEEAFERVRADKEREARDGHDGTWVAHPDLVPVAKEVFDRLMPGPNQLDRLRDDVQVTQEDLLRIHEGSKTEEGFRHNIRVGVQYIEAWLRGRGAVPIYNLMEDAATAEISRAQIWQWIKYGVELDTGVTATPDFFRRALDEEMDRVREEVGPENYDAGRFPDAIDLFSRLSLADEFEDFLTIPAYRLIV